MAGRRRVVGICEDDEGVFAGVFEEIVAKGILFVGVADSGCTFETGVCFEARVDCEGVLVGVFKGVFVGVFNGVFRGDLIPLISFGNLDGEARKFRLVSLLWKR